MRIPSHSELERVLNERPPGMPRARAITYDERLCLAKFEGPGGFTQHRMDRLDAEAIADALCVSFEARAGF